MRKIFSVQVVVAQLTMGFAALIHRCIGYLYGPLDQHFGFISKTSKEELERHQEYEFKNHIVIAGFNETGLEIAEFFREQGRDVVVIDLDWKLHQLFTDCYKGTRRTQDLSLHKSMSAPVQTWPTPGPTSQLGMVSSVGMSMPPHQPFQPFSNMSHFGGHQSARVFGANFGAGDTFSPMGSPVALPQVASV